MEDVRYTLKELSDELEISVKTLRKHVKNGLLGAAKIGRTYFVSSEELDKFIERTTIRRNYLCPYYSECLYDAAHHNELFNCNTCQRVQEGAMYRNYLDMCDQSIRMGASPW